MIAFTKRYQLLFYILVIFLVATVFFSLKTRQQRFFTLLERGVLTAAYPFQKGIDLVLDRGNAIIDNYVNLMHVKEENRILKNRIANLERKLIGYEEEKRQVHQLQQLLNFKENHQLLPQVTFANVIGQDNGSFSRLLFIDRGSRDRIERYAPVFTPTGIAGRVIGLSPFSAKVMLITDRHSACDVMIQRTRERGILQGENRKLCRLNYLLQSSQVQAGDVVITSGMDGVFPKGMPVGTVVAVRRQANSLSQAVLVQPFAELEQMEEVLVGTVAATEYLHDDHEQ